jgi:hypothetical protein
MTKQFAVVIVGVCLAVQGCGPITYATRTLVIEPVHYCLTADNLLETHRNYQLAESSWKAIVHAEPGVSYSADYAAGFKDGFADYLYAGGTGEPPPLPPRHYWKFRYETPQGHQAIEDWFAGFRHGAAVAQQSGYREWVLLPAAVPPRTLSEPAAEVLPELPAMPPSETVLPPPRAAAPEQLPAPSPNGGHSAGKAESATP